MQREETFFMLMLKDERYICNVVFDKKSYYNTSVKIYRAKS